MVAITLVLHTVWVNGGLAKFGDVVGCILSRTPLPAKNISVVSVLVLGNVTWPPPAVENHPPLLQRHRDIYLPQLSIATIKSPLGLTIHYLIPSKVS
jgi:hypothetical protein